MSGCRESGCSGGKDVALHKHPSRLRGMAMRPCMMELVVPSTGTTTFSLFSMKTSMILIGCLSCMQAELEQFRRHLIALSMLQLVAVRLHA